MLVLMAFSCNQKKPVNQANTVSKPVVVELSITGMSCMGCVETVRSSIAQINGIDTVSVSLENSNAFVTYKSGKTDTVTIRKAVELNGYKVTAAKMIEGVQ